MRKPFGAFPITLLFFVVLLSACSPESRVDTPSERSGDSPQSQQEGSADAAPDFSFETFEGEGFSLAEQRGTPVVLNFWESW